MSDDSVSEYEVPAWAVINADIAAEGMSVRKLPESERFTIRFGSGLRFHTTEEQWDALNAAVKAGMAEALAKSAVTA